MLGTNICSFIIREQPEAVLKHLEQAVLRGHRIVVSAITYAEMRFGATGPKASPRRHADRSERHGDSWTRHRRRGNTGDEQCERI